VASAARSRPANTGRRERRARKRDGATIFG
jgi:hypothetical protein